MRRSLIAVAGVVAASMSLAACSPGTENIDSEPKVLTLGVAGVETFDPAGMAGAGEGLTVWQGVYDTLLTYNEDGKLTPGLATGWSYDDKLTALTVDLRDGVKFSDGAILDAEAVKANFDHFINKKAANIALAGSISSVDIVDSDTVKLSLAKPDPGMEYSLAGPLGAMASPKALNNEDLTTTPVGTGAYEMDRQRSVPQSQIVFTRRDGEHWNAKAWAWDEIILKVMPDQSARINALRAGEIDASMVNAQSYDEVKSNGFEVFRTPGDIVGLGLFDRDGVVQPALANPKVRQAINYAFDRQAMLDSIQLGLGEVTDQIFPGIQPVNGTEYTYDPEKARNLLAEAGYADGFSMTGVDLGTGSPLYAIITDRLAAIGIEMRWQPVAPTGAIAEMFSGKYPTFNSVWTGAGVGNNPWMFVTNTIAPKAVWNVFKNDPPELAALIDEARHATGEKRDHVYAKIDGWLSTNAWFAPFYRVDYLYAVSPEVTAKSAPGNATPFLWSFKPAK